MDCVDELSQDGNKFNNYMRQCGKQAQLKSQKKVWFYQSIFKGVSIIANDRWKCGNTIFAS